MRPAHIALLLFLFPIAAMAHDFQQSLPPTAAVGQHAMVAGCVDVSTGNYIQSCVDLVVNCAEPLELRRSHVSSNSAGRERGIWYLGGETIDMGWHRLSSFGAHVSFLAWLWLIESNGAVIPFTTNEQDPMRWSSSDVEFFPSRRSSHTNTAGGLLSGRTDLDNYRLQKGYSSWTLTTGSGERRTYEQYWEIEGTMRQRDLLPRPLILRPWKKKWKWRTVPNGHVRTRYRLSTIRRPNGNRIEFAYAESGALCKMAAFNREGDCLGWIRFSWADKDKHWVVRVTTSDKQKLKYIVGRDRRTLLAVVYEGGRTERLTYDWDDRYDMGYKRSLVKSSYPEGRATALTYWGRRDGDEPAKTPASHFSSDRSRGQVRELLRPLGPESEMIPAYHFDYGYLPIKPGEDGTSMEGRRRTHRSAVVDTLGNHTLFDRNPCSPLHRIQYFEGSPKETEDNLLLSQTIDWASSYYLIREAIEDRQGRELRRRVFQYDRYGNVAQECLQGDLTGDGESEEYCKESSFGELNIPTEESDGFRLVLSDYKDGSDLLVRRLTYALQPERQLVGREFFQYNDSAQLIEKIEDDGCSEERQDLTGILCRHLLRIHRCASGPEIGLPQQVEELAWDRDSGAEMLLRRRSYEYDERLLPIREHVYDAKGELRYTLEKEYDAARRIVRETDALGNEYTHAYDLNDNRIETSGPNGLYTTRRSYDACNRLIAVTITGPEGRSATRSCRYDLMGNKIAEVDEYGNETTYAYDALGRQTEICLPLVTGQDGEVAHPTYKREYDALGNIILETLPNGETIEKTYTARGQVSSIKYADGAEESFRYNLAGHLISQVGRSGLVTEYERDGLGRELVKRVISSEGEVEAELIRTYHGDRVTSTTNSKGETVFFSYDGAGRLVEERCADRRTTYSYDALGRKAKTSTWLDGSCCCSIWEYDAMGNVLEERVETHEGHLCKRFAYAYDACGRLTEEMTFEPSGDCHSKQTEYDFLNRPVRIVDPQGNQLLIDYDAVSNELDQMVSQKRAVDALGRETLITSDALGRTRSKEVQGAFGERLDLQSWSYNMLGQRTEHRHEIHRHDGGPRTVVHRWTYGLMGRLALLEEACGDARYRETRYAYDCFGRLSHLIKPSGRALHFEYDAFGRLSRQYAASFDYRFSYDSEDQLVSVTDQEGGTLTRTFDPLGRLIGETLPTGLKVSFARDPLGRCTKATLPDGSGIGYTYNAAHMTSIQRLDQQGRVRYSHRYQMRDLSGRAVKEELPFGLGMLSCEWDSLGYKRSLNCPYHACRRPDAGLDAVGNVRHVELWDGLESYACSYEYDELDQLAHEAGVEEHTYVIDSRGDRVWEDGREFCTDAVGCVPEKGEQLEFDLDGRLIERHQRRQSTHYTYDDLDRLVAVEMPTMRLHFTYDALNRRLTKKRYVLRDDTWAIDLDLRFIYFGQEEVGAVNPEGEVVELRVLGESSEAIAIELGPEPYVPLHDLRGDILSLVSSDGEVVESYRYTAFGREVNGSALGNPWRFGGRRIDDETNFVLFGQRFYWAGRAYGRWITPDPLGYAEGPNLYAYCGNNPLAYRDLSGLSRSSATLGLFETNRNQLAWNWSDERLRLPPEMLSGTDFESWKSSTPYGRQIFPRKSDGWGCTTADKMSEIYFGKRYEATDFGVVYWDGFERFLGAPSSCRLHLGRRESQAGRIVFVNGIRNSLNDCLDHMRYLSGVAGGMNVHAVYNASHGIFRDLVESHLQEIGIAGTSIHLLHEEWNDFFKTAPPDSCLLTVCFSQGCIIAKLSLITYPKDLRKRILVLAIAPAAFIDEKLCGGIHHVFCKYDPVPGRAYNPERYGHTSTILDPRPGEGFINHFFQADIYEPSLRADIRDYFKISRTRSWLQRE